MATTFFNPLNPDREDGSILSDRPDGFDFYYGFIEGDNRQVNVRQENGHTWTAYAGGEKVGDGYPRLLDAERAAIDWMKAHPNE